MTFADIQLYRNERGFLAGGTGTGKSFCEEILTQAFVNHYRKENAIALILDSKPRFRAQWLETGVSASRLYRKWDHGKAMPGSYLVNLDNPKASMRASYDLGGRIFIATAHRAAEFGFLLQTAERFFEDARAKQPRLLVVDEFMDFFNRNGTPIEKNDILLRSIRAGRELGVSVLEASQRTFQIPLQALSEATKFYVFRVDNVKDVEHLYRMGLPSTVTAPMRDRVFAFYDKSRRVGATVKLRVEAK